MCVSMSLVSLLALVVIVATTPLPGIKPCPAGSDELDKCIENSLNAYLVDLAKGYGEEVPPLDPLSIPFVETEFNDKNATLSLNLKNVLVQGLSHSKIYDVKAKNSLEEGKLEMMCKTPKISVTGTYQSEGAVITFPLHSSGTFNVTLVDLTTHLIVHLDGDGDHIQVTSIGLQVMPAQVNVEAGKTLDDDNSLGNSLGLALNSYLNENSFELYELVRPRLMAFFSEMIKDVANSLLKQATVDTVFPDLDLRK